MSVSNSDVGAFILIIRAPGVEQNLLGGHVVVVNHEGENTGLLRHIAITPNVLAFIESLLILEIVVALRGKWREAIQMIEVCRMIVGQSPWATVRHGLSIKQDAHERGHERFDRSVPNLAKGAD